MTRPIYVASVFGSTSVGFQIIIHYYPSSTSTTLSQASATFTASDTKQIVDVSNNPILAEWIDGIEIVPVSSTTHYYIPFGTFNCVQLPSSGSPTPIRTDNFAATWAGNDTQHVIVVMQDQSVLHG
jgi:hypothetical protein